VSAHSLRCLVQVESVPILGAARMGWAPEGAGESSAQLAKSTAHVTSASAGSPAELEVRRRHQLHCPCRRRPFTRAPGQPGNHVDWRGLAPSAIAGCEAARAANRTNAYFKSDSAGRSHQRYGRPPIVAVKPLD